MLFRSEPLIESSLKGLGMQDSIWEKTLLSFFTSNPLQVADALGDCKKLTTLIAHSFVEGLVMMMQKQS